MSNLVDDLSGLGFAGATTTEQASPEPVRERAPATLVRGSPTARALFEVWTGQRCVIVDSPPGGGKTRLMVTIAAHLVVRGCQHITLAAFTRAQVVTLANRLADQIDPELIDLRLSGADPSQLIKGINHRGATREPGKGMVTVSTLASCARRSAITKILLVDEAYQATFASVAAAANGAEQMLLVGDPGQIGPVVPIDTGAWEHMRAAPHRPAPIALAARPNVQRVRIGSTYRLGPVTTETIAALYDFPFDSARPDRKVTDARGRDVCEVESLSLATNGGGPEDESMLWQVAHRARDLAEAAVTDASGTNTISQCGVAVVVAQNSQVTILTAMLAGLGAGQVTVGTADSLQGGQWDAVVAVDPLAGGVTSEHHTSAGRLCVMASRHTAHLTWAHEPGTGQPVNPTGRSARRAAQVRTGLAAAPAAYATLLARPSGVA